MWTDFVRRCRDDSDRYEQIADWPLWDQLKEDRLRREALDRKDLSKRRQEGPAFTRPTVTGDELIPPDEADALQCMRVAGGDATRFDELYEDTDSSAVFYRYALQIASEYHQQLTERDVPERHWYEGDPDADEYDEPDNLRFA